MWTLATINVASCCYYYYPCDAVSARALILAMTLCLFVCLSIPSRCSIETAGRIKLVFGMVYFDISYTTVIRKFEYLEEYRYLPLKLFPKLRH